ncbi:MAG: DMT family transporter [Cyanobacteria bacterium SBLK]|nr:DMT family transporter [Cyanobacteria bacterium SBLK]
MTLRLDLPAPNSTRTKLAIAIALAASVLLGLMPILIRIAEDYMSPNAVTFNRFWVISVIIGAWQVTSRLTPQNKQFSESSSYPDTKIETNTQKLIVPLMILAIAFVGTQLLWAWSLSQTAVANSEILHSLAPGFTVLAGWLLFKQTFGSRFLVGIAIATMGAIAIGISDFSSSISLGGDGLALLSAVFWAAYFMSVEKLRSQFGAMAILLWASGTCALLCFPVVLVVEDGILPQLREGWIVLTILAFNTIACHGSIAYTLKWLSSGLVATILLLSPILTAIMGWLLFSETLSLLNILGFTIVLVGVYFVISES